MEMTYVSSANRGAARKLLVTAGHPAADVRNWPKAKLGAVLRERFASMDDAGKAAINAALAGTSSDDDGDDAQPVTVQPATTPAPAVKGGRSPLAEAIIGELEAAGYKASGGVDEAAVAAIVDSKVAAAVEAARIRPSVIEIREGGKVATVDGHQHPMFDTVVRSLSAGVHVWLVGPAGSGKSTLACNAAKALGRDYYMTGAVASQFQLTGYVSPTGDERTLLTPFRRAFEFGGVFVFDDTDRSDAKALAAFNEALANGRFTFADRTVDAHPAFIAVATANTWGRGNAGEYVGASKLDAATLDRFVQLFVGYDEELERQIAGAEFAGWVAFVQSCRKAVDGLGMKHLITPRATLKGAKLLAAGIDRHTVERAVLFAGLDSESEARIRAAA